MTIETSISGARGNLSTAKQQLLKKRLQGQARGAGPLSIIPRRERSGNAPLSFAQQRLWFLDQWAPHNPVYNICEGVHLKGALDDAALEQSRRGAHLWIFGEQPLLARQCRLLISGLAQKLGIPIKGAGTAEGIEIFPKHDELKDGDFGNAIRGPLGIHRTISARFWFYGADYNLDNQLAFLKRVTKLSEEQLGALLQKLGQPSEGKKKEIKPTPRWQYPAQQRQFHILDHLQVRRKTGRNWITRCPSCAAAGRDKSGDNLAISVDEPQKYICWAGCSKEMIRAALGCPIPEKRESAYAVG